MFTNVFTNVPLHETEDFFWDQISSLNISLPIPTDYFERLLSCIQITVSILKMFPATVIERRNSELSHKILVPAIQLPWI